MSKRNNPKKASKGRKATPQGSPQKKNVLIWTIGMVTTLSGYIRGVLRGNMTQSDAIILGIGSFVIWVAFYYQYYPEHNKWLKHLKLFHNLKVWWSGTILLLIGTCFLANHVHRDDELFKKMSDLQKQYHSRLINEFDLGYVILGFGSSNTIYIPSTNNFEVDWRKITLTQGERNTGVITFPRIHDTRDGTDMYIIRQGISLTPNANLIGIKKGNTRIRFICLRSIPNGVVVVVGFEEVES